jgi:uncharacterized protein with GYD domain
MPTYVATIKFTPQGVGGIAETTQRAAAFKAAARKMGVKVRDVYWTLGAFDGLLVLDAPDEETAAAALLHLASKGNVQTTTARAFDAAEMEAILAKIPK